MSRTYSMNRIGRRRKSAKTRKGASCGGAPDDDQKEDDQQEDGQKKGDGQKEDDQQEDEMREDGQKKEDGPDQTHPPDENDNSIFSRPKPWYRKWQSDESWWAHQASAIDRKAKGMNMFREMKKWVSGKNPDH